MSSKAVLVLILYVGSSAAAGLASFWWFRRQTPAPPPYSRTIYDNDPVIDLRRFPDKQAAAAARPVRGVYGLTRDEALRAFDDRLPLTLPARNPWRADVQDHWYGLHSEFSGGPVSSCAVCQRTEAFVARTRQTT